MFEFISIGFALVILIIAAISAIKNRNNVSVCTSCILLGVFFSTFFMVLPTEWIKEGKEIVIKPLYIVLSSLLYSFKTLGGRQDIAQIETIALAGVVKTVYIALNYVSFVLAPILASSLLLSFIGDTGEKIRFGFKFSKKCYVFSEINENSIALAKGIKKKKGSKTLVFCLAKKADKELITKARELGGITFYKECQDIKIRRRFREYEFLAISENEDKNIQLAEAIITKNAKVKKTKVIINAFVESGTNVKFLESVLKTKKDINSNLELRCIDEIAFFCNHLIYTHPLYNTKGSKNISVAIIGCGRTGMRMLKTVYWAGQIDGYKLKIRVYDKNAENIQGEFYKDCPGLKDNKTIEFIKADVDSISFKEQLLKKKNSLDATYIVAALGSDQLNLIAAEEIYKIYRRARDFKNDQMPEIFARVRSQVKSNPFFDNAEFLSERCVHLFGTTDSIFSDETLFNTELENLAFAVDLAYSGILKTNKGDEAYDNEYKKFVTSEYDRRSSMATALHIPAKLCMCKEIPVTAENNLTDENIKIYKKCLKNNKDLKERLARNEHDRWNAFMLSEGYQSADIKEMFRFADITGKNRDDESMLHSCITDWDNLDVVESEFNKRYNQDKTFKKYDKDIVQSVPEIWEKVQKIKGDEKKCINLLRLIQKMFKSQKN